MKRSVLFIFTLILGTLIMAGNPKAADSGANNPRAADPENTLYMDIKDGRVVIRMRPDLAPNHVKRIKELVRQGFYDGLVFHRVIEDFMAQTGDPTGTGKGGSGVNLDAELSYEQFRRGVVGMARGAERNSADSQFFIIMGKEAPWLDGQYTIWGNVVSGMEFVDKIERSDNNDTSGMVVEPDKIIKMQVEADVKEDGAKK